MREVFGYVLFDLGSVWQIARLPIGQLSDESRLVIYHCINVLRGVANDVNNMKDMPHAIAHMKFIAEKLENLLKDKEINITSDGRDIFIYDISTLRTLLFSEMGKLSIILLEEKRGYSANTLWKYPYNLLPNDIEPLLSDFVKENLKEAAKCLALDCYTAAGFHAMRSVEKVSRKYYELITGNPPPYKDRNNREHFKMLGGIAQELIDKCDSFQHKKIPCGELPIIAPMIKGLCKTYRDPLAHPEIIKLDDDVSIDVFTDTVQLISRIVRDSRNGGNHFTGAWASGALF
jgi:hypothetical protein